MENVFDKRAIHRVKMSAPAKELLKLGLLKSPVLDYGCGHGLDGEYLNCMGFQVTSYDPVYRPIEVTGKFKTILCIYVLNIIKEQQEKEIITQLKKLLENDGVAFLAVRRDWRNMKNYRCNQCTSLQVKCRAQRLVYLDLPIICENRNFCIYKMTKTV